MSQSRYSVSDDALNVHYCRILAKQRTRPAVAKPLATPVTEPVWVVLFVEPRSEDKVEQALTELGYAVFVPRETVWARIPDHRRTPGGPSKQRVTRPLFPRYVFIGLHPREHSLMPARLTEGVVNVVTAAAEPLRVPSRYLDALRAAEAAGDHDRASDEAAALARLLGSQVVIASGLFAGFAATVLRVARREVEVEVESGQNRLKLKLGRDALGV